MRTPVIAAIGVAIAIAAVAILAFVIGGGGHRRACLVRTGI